MARHNNVSLYGQVMEVKVDESGGKNRVRCGINILRGVRDTEKQINNLQYDCPILMSKNAKIVEEMARWKPNDIVEIKGVICTARVKKNIVCAYCGEKETHEGFIAYINPIHVLRVETGLSDQECINRLKDNCEISNQVQIIGNLCADPETYHAKSGSVQTQYQLAINRKYRIKEDQVEIRTDYPFVKSFGKIAKSDELRLKKGSLILLDGMLQTRDAKKEQECPHCKKTFTWVEPIMEIIPFSIEYLQNYRTDEELASIEAQRLADAKKMLE